MARVPSFEATPRDEEIFTWEMGQKLRPVLILLCFRVTWSFNSPCPQLTEVKDPVGKKERSFDLWFLSPSNGHTFCAFSLA